MSDRKKLLPLVLLATLAIIWSSTGVRAATTVKTRLISQSSAGVHGDAESYLPSITADGRLVAFESGSTNLILNDTNDATDIFLRDRATNRTTRVSVRTSGGQANGGSYNASISADGRYVAFISDASNLVANDTNDFTDVFVRDRVKQVTKRVSVNTAGFQGNGSSYEPTVSDDGRFVVFYSAASNLVLNDTNGVNDVFVRDRVKKTTTRVSVSTDGDQADGASLNPSMSGNGRYVAFESVASNLVANDTNTVSDIFVRDRRERLTRRPSISTAGDEGDGPAGDPAISDDGRFVAFVSAATNLVGNDTNGQRDIFVRDRGRQTTRRVSVSSAGVQTADFPCYQPAITPDGRSVAFVTTASNLVGNDTNAAEDVFVRDRTKRTTKRVSVSSAGIEGDNRSIGPALSDDGRTVAFYATATNLVANDENANDDVFVRGRT